MKRIISVLLLLLLCLSLCACGGYESTPQYTREDLAGTWIRDKYVNPQGNEYNITIHLHADGTYVKEESSSAGEYKEIHGTWEIEKDQIHLGEEKLVAGTDFRYDENGNAEFSESGIYLKIYDTNTIKNGDLFYSRES